MLLFFQTIDFPQRFFETPTLVTTTKHLKDDVNSHIAADNNAITEWIEVSTLQKTTIFLTQLPRHSFRFSKVNLYQTRISLHILHFKELSLLLNGNAINGSYPGPLLLTSKPRHRDFCCLLSLSCELTAP